MRIAKSRPARARDYPPLVLAALVMLALLAVMPSALNLPQSSPAETLEYAPVPPEDDNQVTPPAGNFSSLGLGSSSAGPLAGDSEVGGDPPPPAFGGRAVKAPSTKRCVGDPPRQTEDPLSPPCVAFYSGDNGGATYLGVSREEVRVLFYFDGAPGQAPSSRGQEPRAVDKYVDLALPPEEDEQVQARMLRLYQRHFNERFQTYGRFVHFFVYYDSNSTTAEARRANAAANFDKIKPFAVANNAFLGATNPYSEVMNRKGVLVFTGMQNLRTPCCTAAADFLKSQGLRWAVAASTERYTQQISDMVCKQIVGRPVSYGGNAADQGQPRRLGLIVNSASSQPERVRLARAIESDVRACGGNFVAEWINDTQCGSADDAGGAVADFRSKGVTTVIWPSGPNPAAGECAGNYFANAAAGSGYLPEVVMTGDGSSESTVNGQVVNQEFFRHTIALTPYTRADQFERRPCVQAAREVDPASPRIDLETYACDLYDTVRLMFTGIQVAGPRLTPRSMETGFHAIPAAGSPDPRVGACFFSDRNDYTCSKDSMLVHWDPSGKDPGASGSGCWRMIEGGRRYLAGDWPSRDIAAPRRPDDPCNRQGFTL